MKKILSILAMSTLLIFGLSGCGSDIDIVKDGVVEYDDSIGVGDAFDNWKECKDSEWTEWVTDNKKRIVQFNCNVNYDKTEDTVRKYLTKEKNYSQENAEKLVQKYVPTAFQYIFQFTVKKDDTFELSYAGNKLAYKNGQKSENTLDMSRIINKVYKNSTDFDKDYEKMEGLEAFYFYTGLQHMSN